MIESPNPTSAQQESRLELAVAAAAAERANRPRWIVVLGGALLVVAIIFTVVKVSAHSSALIQVDRERKRTQDILLLKAEIEAEQNKLRARGTAEDFRVGQHIEAIAAASGIEIQNKAVVESTLAAQPSIGMQQHKYAAKLINQDPQAIFNWLIALQRAPDTRALELSRLRLTPGAGTAANTPGWNADIEWTRWQRLKQ